MISLILSGGKGTRLRPLTLHTPKPLLPVLNKPFLSYPLAILRKYGVREAVLCIADSLAPYHSLMNSEQKAGTLLEGSREFTELGTAGAMKNAEKFLNSEPVFILNGDVLNDIDLSRMIHSHKQSKSSLTIALRRVDNPSAFGLVCTEKSGRITRFVEKPNPADLKRLNIKSYWVNAGIYIFEREIFELIPKGRKFSAERELFPLCLKNKVPMHGYFVNKNAYWLDVGTPEKYLLANTRATLNRFGRFFPNSSKLTEISSTAKVHRSVKIGRNTVIGSHSHVGPGCSLEECVILDGASIGENVTLSHCVVGKKARIGKYSQINSSAIIGDKSIITPYSQI